MTEELELEVIRENEENKEVLVLKVMSANLGFWEFLEILDRKELKEMLVYWAYRGQKGLWVQKENREIKVQLGQGDQVEIRYV